MMSRIFCCNPTILKKNLTRYWPIMALCAFIGFMLLPMAITGADDDSVAWYLYDIVSYAMPLLIFGYAPLCAACVFGYLHKSRSSNMLHAFPITRNSLFMSNLLSGLAMFVLPWLAVCLITFFQFLSNGIALSMLLSTFAIGCLEFLFFFAVAVFSMLLCGKTVYGILIYLFLNAGLALMELFVLLTVEPFLYGIEVGYTMLSEYLPLIYLLNHPVWEVIHSVWSVEVCCSWGALVSLGSLGIGFLALAWRLYRKRHMEHCGDPIAYPRIQPVVLVVVSLFISLALGLFITAIAFAGGVSAKNATGMHIAMLVGGFIGFFGVEMLLRKTTRVFKKKTFIGYGLFALVLSLGMLCVRFDWLNIVCYVPESDCVTVEYSELYYGSDTSTRLVLTDEESIAAIRELHQYIVNNRNLFTDWTDRRDRYYLNLSYKLDNGKVLNRKYEIWTDPFYHQTRTVYDAFESFLCEKNPTLSYIQSLALDISLAENAAICMINVDRSEKIVLKQEQFDSICEAMRLDIEEGNLNLLTLMSARKRLTYSVYEDIMDETGPDYTQYFTDGYLLQIHTHYYPRSNGCYCDNTAIYIPETATHTYTLLTELLN